MNWDQALDEMKLGKTVKRPDWKNSYVMMRDSGAVARVVVDGFEAHMQPDVSPMDITATDWEIVR